MRRAGEIEVSQILVHKTHRPNALLDFSDADGPVRDALTSY